MSKRATPCMTAAAVTSRRSQAQFLCRGYEEQQEVARLFHGEEMGMEALTLTIDAASKIRKAVIPARPPRAHALLLSLE